MKKMLILLLGAILITILSYLCFIGKSDDIKSDLVTKANSLYGAKQMNWVDVKVKGNNLELTRILTLDGTAPTEELKLEAEKMALGLKGVTSVDNRLVVEQIAQIQKSPAVEPVTEVEIPLPVEVEKQSVPSPYELMVSKSEEKKIVVQGYVPDEKVHNTVIEKATTLFGKEHVVDELKESEGAPKEWADSVMLGLDKLAVVDYGKFKIVDDVFTFKGHVGELSQKDALLQSFGDRLSSNYKGNYEIDAPKAEVEKVEDRPKAVFSCQEAFKKVLVDKKINFEYNKADIKPDSYDLLDDIVNVAKKCPDDAIEIGGHTDSIGSDRYNAKLSKSRANAVKEYLIEKGIEEGRLKAVGYGERKPISDNSTQDGRDENRRIEFNIIDIKDVKILKDEEDSTLQTIEKNQEVNFDNLPLAKLTKLDEKEPTVVSQEVQEIFEPISKSVWKRAFSCQEQFQTMLSDDKIHFAYNKAEVSPKSYALLNKLSKIGRSCEDKVIYIGGHTDSDGDAGYNKRLSKERAETIKEYFVKRGVPSDRLIAVGYGETRPIADNNTDSGKAKNRRIEFYVKGVK